MGFGYLEAVYQKCFLIELKKAGLTAESKIPITVLYEKEIVGEFIADVLIENSIIIEIKSIRQLAKIHEMQLVNYLVATQKKLGLLINIGEEEVEFKRKVRILQAIKT